ncbi:MAG: hypothetical protein PHW83_10285 [Bacteroidales bacterium]|nr:hypothetical protein [Bacteroidales bacterium]
MKNFILIMMMVWPFVAFSQSGANSPDKCKVLNNVIELMSDKNYDELKTSGTEYEMQTDLFAYDCPFILDEFDDVWFFKNIIDGVPIYYVFYIISEYDLVNDIENDKTLPEFSDFEKCFEGWSIEQEIDEWETAINMGQTTTYTITKDNIFIIYEDNVDLINRIVSIGIYAD